MLPTEEENLKHIYNECWRILDETSNCADTDENVDATADDAALDADTSPNIAQCVESTLDGIEALNLERTKAMKLLAHVDTALAWICHTRPKHAGTTACSTFERFLEISRPVNIEPMDMIDSIIVDGDAFKVRFKAGVEV